ncbi:uncharacterized protein K489DRAFT_197005 [Dissoconium aciculare CBS 342.82]|jgi:hypothetical protein|uniref:Uncharacterized protein n=1 Tax=Dissoconium aciculare CBS 342.82 TaxID=1314786 RepID=A0A6J3M7G0_9PEZI|nr:uncharacterized protein K489DRAFT_197005 [Dissoconium aciculare CBS 342.82]KAF1823479.1 hypothetical protein K489DRAFT_197005 [Dissoconium aciculare CBS 342.82]
MTTSPRRVAARIVEVRPAGYGPARPITPPKEVRFAVGSDDLTRNLDADERWAVFHWEAHARKCNKACGNFNDTSRHHAVCETGRPLAHALTQHAVYHKHEIYSTRALGLDAVRLELKSNYRAARNLLKAVSQGFSLQPTVRIHHSYAPLTPPLTPVMDDRASSHRSYSPPRDNVIIEPAASSSPRYTTRRTYHRYPRAALFPDDTVDYSGYSPATSSQQQHILVGNSGAVQSPAPASLSPSPSRPRYRTELHEPSLRHTVYEQGRGSSRLTIPARQDRYSTYYA